MKKTNLLIALFLSATLIEVSSEVVGYLYSLKVTSVSWSGEFFTIFRYLKYIVDGGYIVPYILAKVFFFVTLIEVLKQYFRKD